MKLLQFPCLRQTYNYDCGPKALQSVFVYYGLNIREDIIMQESGTTPERGTPVQGLLACIRARGLSYTAGNMTVEQLRKYVDEGTPVILLVQAWSAKRPIDWEDHWEDGHYVVAIGYDANHFYFEDPSSFQPTKLTVKELLARWHDQDPDGQRYVHYGIAVHGQLGKYSTEPVEMK